MLAIWVAVSFNVSTNRASCWDTTIGSYSQSLPNTSGFRLRIELTSRSRISSDSSRPMVFSVLRNLPGGTAPLSNQSRENSWAEMPDEIAMAHASIEERPQTLPATVNSGMWTMSWVGTIRPCQYQVGIAKDPGPEIAWSSTRTSAGFSHSTMDGYSSRSRSNTMPTALPRSASEDTSRCFHAYRLLLIDRKS